MWRGLEVWWWVEGEYGAIMDHEVREVEVDLGDGGLVVVSSKADLHDWQKLEGEELAFCSSACACARSRWALASSASEISTCRFAASRARSA